MKVFYFLMSFCLYSINIHAFTDYEFVLGLEDLEEWEQAYQHANDSALKTSNYELWRYIASKDKYLPFEEKNHHQSYWKAWYFVSKINTQEAYEDFILIRPTLQANLLAVHAIFELVKKQNTPQAYLDFIDKFPNTVEAIDALLQLQILAFEDAKQKNTIASYQKFLTAFPQSPQTKEAADLLKATFKKEVEEKLATLKTNDEIEYYARGLLNNILAFDKNPELKLVADYHYFALTELMAFKNTTALTDLYKNDGNKALLSKLDDIRKDLNDIKKGQEELKIALIEAIREQGREIKGEIKELSELTKQHHEQMKSQLQQISDGLETGGLIIGATSIATTLVSAGANLWGISNLTKTNTPYIPPINITTAKPSSSLNWKTITKGTCGVLTKIPMIIPNPAVVVSRIACKFLPIALIYFSA